MQSNIHQPIDKFCTPFTKAILPVSHTRHTQDVDGDQLADVINIMIEWVITLHTELHLYLLIHD